MYSRTKLWTTMAWENRLYAPLFVSQSGSSLMHFYSNRTSKIINQNIFKIRWWKHRERSVKARWRSVNRRPQTNLWKNILKLVHSKGFYPFISMFSLIQSWIWDSPWNVIRLLMLWQSKLSILISHCSHKFFSAILVHGVGVDLFPSFFCFLLFPSKSMETTDPGAEVMHTWQTLPPEIQPMAKTLPRFLVPLLAESHHDLEDGSEWAQHCTICKCPCGWTTHNIWWSHTLLPPWTPKAHFLTWKKFCRLQFYVCWLEKW